MNRAFIAVFGIAVFAAILFGSLAFDSVLAAKEPKVTICHVDPDGDGAGLETLEVNGHSLTKHLAHGDHVGACFVCGDGFEEGAEECDDGNNNNNDACLNSCQDAMCGDEVIQTGIEECDGENLDEMTCKSVGGEDGFNPEGNLQGNVKGYLGLPNGFPNGGQLACDENCFFDISECNDLPVP